MRIVGLDLGVKCISFCEVRDGVVIARRTVRSVEELDDVLGPEAPPARVAVEACREAWSVHDRLRDAGHEPVLVDTTRVKQVGIGAHRRKTDRIDAEVLARALEANRIPRAHVLSPARRRISKAPGSTREVHPKLQGSSTGEVGGILGVEVKFVDIERNTGGEGGQLDEY